MKSKIIRYMLLVWVNFNAYSADIVAALGFHAWNSYTQRSTAAHNRKVAARTANKNVIRRSRLKEDNSFSHYEEPQKSKVYLPSGRLSSQDYEKDPYNMNSSYHDYSDNDYMADYEYDESDF